MPDRRYAILIGTGHYTDSALSALRCPAQDVTGLAAVLGDPALGRFEPVVPLVDQPHEVLLEQTQQTLQQAGRDDTILFYFSGHGITDDQGRLYLAATNTRRRILGGTSLPIEQIKEWFDTYRSTRVIVILDCCFSGAAEHTFAKNTLDNTLQQQLAPGRGKYILTASTATAVAQEKDGDAYSVFTKHLIEGLQSGAADLDHTPDGHITIDALYRYVYSQVRADNGQEPMRWDLNRKGDHMIIAWRRQADHPAAQVAVQAYIDTILQRWQQGEVIPVLGPGVGERNASAHPPIFADLARQLAQRARVQTGADLPLSLVSQTIHMRDDRDSLYRHVKALHHPEAIPFLPTLTHHFLAQIQRPLLILSTAYDTLLEDAFAARCKPYVVVTHPLYGDQHRGKVAVLDSTDPGHIDLLSPDELRLDFSRGTYIYKLHGGFGFLDAEGEEIDSLVISEEDYLALLALLEHPQTTIPNQFIRHFRRSTFLFLGYHMHDWNFRAMLDVMQRKGRFDRVQSYAVCRHPPEFERLYWAHKRVRLIDMHVDDFLRQALAPALGITL